MKDFFKNELKVGDFVALQPKNYRFGFVKATIVKITAQRVRVEYLWDGSKQQYIVEPNCVVKFPQENN
jgi:hypothetical protein